MSDAIHKLERRAMRVEIAGRIMAGIDANPHEQFTDMAWTTMAENSVAAADALIAELERTPQPAALDRAPIGVPAEEESRC